MRTTIEHFTNFLKIILEREYQTNINGVITIENFDSDDFESVINEETKEEIVDVPDMLCTINVKYIDDNKEEISNIIFRIFYYIDDIDDLNKLIQLPLEIEYFLSQVNSQLENDNFKDKIVYAFEHFQKSSVSDILDVNDYSNLIEIALSKKGYRLS